MYSAMMQDYCFESRCCGLYDTIPAFIHFYADDPVMDYYPVPGGY